MIDRMMRALSRSRDDGFTLIELLVVVLIIGILAAIAVPVYIGVQNGAKNSATQSDLANAKTAEKAYMTSHDGTITQDKTQLAGLGWTSSSGVTLTIHPASSAGAFCIDGSVAATSKSYWASDTAGVAAGSCPAS